MSIPAKVISKLVMAMKVAKTASRRLISMKCRRLIKIKVKRMGRVHIGWINLIKILKMVAIPMNMEQA